MARNYSLLVLAAFVGFSLRDNTSVLEFAATRAVEEDLPAQAIPVNNPTSKNCLAFDGELEHLISSANQVFITMPAKAAGTSLKSFSQKCTHTHMKDNFINLGKKDLRKFMLDSLEVPKLVASHVYGDSSMLELIEHGSPDTLHVHMYRNERDRLLSAIKEVINTQAGDAKYNQATTFDLISRGKKKVIINEDVLIDQAIVKEHAEIGIGNGKSLSCKVFDAMEQHAPNLIFVHYEQANNLQKLLAAKFCPEMNAQQANVDDAKKVKSFVQLKNGTQVPLQDWLDHKKDVLEWVLDLSTRSDCQSKTKQLEKVLKACPDQVVRPVHYEFEY